ncbi:hypothetical protein E4U21_005395 [Claviceps maximensis]|nr:hypothetical protein E4U21_005395 [Claviceps maximensis]
MQFSTSAALAAIVALAGQSLAACTLESKLPVWSYNLDPCSAGSANSWTCGAVTNVARIASTEFIIHAGPQGSSISISCPDDNKSIVCTAGAYGVFNINCPGGIRIRGADSIK